MIEPESHEKLRREMSERIRADRELLEGVRDEIRPLRAAVRRIQPRSTTDLPGRCVIDFASRRATHGELGRT
jgi:hypothetical protein